MKSKNKYVLAGALALAVCLLTTLVVVAQSKQKGKQSKPIELKAQKPTTRGAEKDPNIISDSQTNDPNAKIDPPESKGGPKARGGSCEVRFDNSTKYLIKLYIDGKYRGTIGPFDDAVGYALPGETRVYARADFEDGTYLYWGPKTYDCRSGQYIYFKMNY